MQKSDEKSDEKTSTISFISFPSKEVFDRIYSELSDEGKKELERLMKEGKVRIY